MNSVVQNPFAQQQAQQMHLSMQHGGAMQEAAAGREIAEVQSAMVIAKKFPRDPIQAADSIRNACTRPSLAESAIYSYARGGSQISGPSIRLAEAIAQQWGNIHCGLRILERGGESSTVEAFAWDLQTNVRQVKVFHVSHMRHTKRGSYRLEDERDIRERVDNQGARHLRGCILRVVPGDLTEMAVQQCEQTLRASADTSAEGIKKMLAAFREFGVDKEPIEKRIQCRIDAIRPAQVVQLKKIYASLRDGMSAAGDWFELDAVPEGGAAGKESLLEKTRRAKERITRSGPSEMPPEEGSANDGAPVQEGQEAV